MSANWQYFVEAQADYNGSSIRHYRFTRCTHYPTWYIGVTQGDRVQQRKCHICMNQLFKLGVF